MAWREEGHGSLSLASDSSGLGWGGALLNSDGQVVREVGDSWCETMLSSPIHVRETVALSCTLRSFGDVVRNRHLDVLVDSSVLYGCWERQYASSHSKLEALKDLFWKTVGLNVAISLQLVKSPDNPADFPSRRLSLVHSTHTPTIWSTIQSEFGGSQGHTCDLMALDSNAQRDNNGTPLPHIAQVPTPKVMAVNLFTQDIARLKGSVFESCYVFPPFLLIGPVLKFLREQKACCTIVVPDRYLLPYWWPILHSESSL